ncbi:MAG TPA: isochorismatase family cysteine hydrolase, partial [Saprospiraceae bacterium]|nr:isochorismatase family cysteine hydrolase [Saprospiraceae bacterium]
LMDFVQVQPGEKLVQKSTASAFINTDLSQYIEQRKIDSLVVTGFVTNNSVEATARNAGVSGIDTTVVSDATACFDKVAMNGTKFTSDVVHALSLANLKDEYATIMTTDEILAALESTTHNLKSTI